MSYPSYGQSAHEPTIVKPTPGGRRSAPVQIVAPPTDFAPEDTVDLTLGGLNPLVAAAGPILTLIRRLRVSAGQSNIEELRERVASEIKTFEKRAQATGVSSEAARAAHYALCATVDDVVLNTPWGGGQRLVAGRHGHLLPYRCDGGGAVLRPAEPFAEGSGRQHPGAGTDVPVPVAGF
ncbi:MAG: type IVB secretion system protein IcmH/DotU [Azospirillaceae bacterium]|nr:type IVB secretion system protein IcmH/DotU [Azospirillaceae bacterium]